MGKAAEMDGDRFTDMITVVLMVYVAVFGVCVGSFANVLIYRIPNGLSFIKGTSFCPECKKRIMPYDLIPILSYIILRGKCRYCKTGISIKYPIVELLAGGLAVLAVWVYGFSAAALTGFFIFIVLLCVSFIDAEHMLIPDGLVISLALLSIAHAVFCGNVADIGLLSRAAGFFICSLPMLGLTLLIENAFGGGDIKLIAVCGFLLGFKLTLLAGFIAVLLGGLRGVYIKYIKKDRGAVYIAFGQYICVGVFVAMLFGEEIIRGYLALMSL